jgi:NTE family protein
VIRDGAVLVDGAAINNLPVDVMQAHAPGLVIGCDAGADHSFAASLDGAPPFWRFFARDRHGKPRINIFQVLMHAGMVSSVAGLDAQRTLADVMLRPPLANIDLLDWRAFDRAIEAGHRYARETLAGLSGVPRLAAPAAPRASSLAAELERRIAAKAAAAG